MTLKIDKDEVFERSHGERSIVTYDHTKVVLGFFLHSACLVLNKEEEGRRFARVYLQGEQEREQVPARDTLPPPEKENLCQWCVFSNSATRSCA